MIRLTERSLLLAGSLGALAELPRLVEGWASEAHLSGRRAYSLRLALDEVVTNIVTHGYEENGLSGGIEISWSVDDLTGLTVTVQDDGPLFDPTSLDDPEGMDLPLEERSLGGLGVMLARNSVDQFTYEVRRNRNCVTLVMLPSTSEEESH